MEATKTRFSTDRGIGEFLIFYQLENYKRKGERF